MKQRLLLMGQPLAVFWGARIEGMKDGRMEGWDERMR
jgi:hypothetical protein